MIAHFDTSGFVKLFVDEAGSDEVADLWSRADHAVASALLYPETRAALAAAVRDGRVGNDEEVRGVAERYVAQVALVSATQALLWRAGDLASRHGLRAYDAVHLASAVAVAVAGTVVVTADRRLAAAARAEGLDVAEGLGA